MIAHRLLGAVALTGLALAPVPATAKSEVAQVAKQLRDPQMQGAMAAAVRAMSDAMLDMNVAPLLRAAEAVRDPQRPRHVDRDVTLRDYAGPGVEEVPEKLSRQLPAMMGAAGGMADAVEEMKPALKDMARQMGAAVGASMAGARGDQVDEPIDDEDIPSAQPE